jgi:hypothetical protein
MVKFIKGSHYLTEKECEKILYNYQNNIREELDGKFYVPLHINYKSAPIDKDNFEQVILQNSTKKYMTTELNVSYYKLCQFMRKIYGTIDLDKVKELVISNKETCEISN